MPQKDWYFYYQYLWSQTSLSKSQASRLVHALQNSTFKKRTLCAVGTTWTLTPMVLTQSSDSYEDNLRLLNKQACADELKKLQNNEIETVKGEIIDIDGHQFIDLP